MCMVAETEVLADGKVCVNGILGYWTLKGLSTNIGLRQNQIQVRIAAILRTSGNHQHVTVMQEQGVGTRSIKCNA